MEKGGGDTSVNYCVISVLGGSLSLYIQVMGGGIHVGTCID